MSTSAPDTAAPRRPAPRHPAWGLRGVQAAAALLIAFGAGGTLIHLADGARRTTVLALAPEPIAAVKDGNAALKGQVTDVFGDKFVLADDTGRALVETGPGARGAALVRPGETVTAQGRFENGALHAAALSHADGRQDALDAGPPPPGPSPLRAGP